ncbi:GGDEF domain-containing protein [Pseudomonas syringae]|nr:GGDEF domain-containing protein [Pseudomonas syringae]MBD8574621.1 GGDEF domain-containing protein [Pseudomonas syringae]MBD8789183.1 GGDEF domain-containing protein [Pseudomonas syringae]MBD8800373.1 GGDEF domain-containing protein [Pseudomonas syringae]MBD8810611.1 GGDEF domain-containing protein [Pseudomonas syringae]
MSSPTRIESVDIDTRVVQSLHAHPRAQNRSTALRPAMDLPQLSLLLARQLQTSLEADRVLGLFFEHLQPYLNLDGLLYSHPVSDLQLHLGQRTVKVASFSLSHEGESLGQLSLYRSQPLEDAQRSELESLLGNLLYPLRNALLYRMAVQNAMRDPLTETGNRIAMEQTLSREAEASSRYRHPLSLLMLDIDHFKLINDNHGHVNGDQVLKRVAQTLKNQVRNVDRVFRYGGEEFVIILANTDRDGAALVGERLRQAVHDLDFSSLGDLRPSISLGCSTLLPAESTESLLRRADSALYVAKRQGRNRMMMAG